MIGRKNWAFHALRQARIRNCLQMSDLSTGMSYPHSDFMFKAHDAGIYGTLTNVYQPVDIDLALKYTVRMMSECQSVDRV